jgi:M6 family metalloprotease-like protein
MQRKSRLALAIVLLLSLSSPVHAAAPKAGSKCTKAGATTTAAGKKYTCIKSGKNLVWDKGFVIPVVVKSPATQVKNLLSSDPRISPISGLSSLDICKTEDKTPDWADIGKLGITNGFPRATASVYAKKQAKVLVIPMAFKDWQFQVEKYQIGQILTSDFDSLTRAIPAVEDAFKKLSGNRFEVKIDVLPQTEWWKLNLEMPFTRDNQESNWSPLFKIINEYKPQFRFDGYDTFAFVAGEGASLSIGSFRAEGIIGHPFANSKSGSFNGILLISNLNDIGLWVHELGHSLFALEDLYLSSGGKNDIYSREVSSVPTNWDLMASVRKIQLLEWNRFLMGWLVNSEVRCLTDQNSTIHYLTDLDTSTDPKLLTINLAPGVTLAAEIRGSTNQEKGLLLYTIDTYILHHEGVVVTQNTLVNKGKSQTIFGWKISVLDSNSEGVLFSVTKTNVDKYVPPAVSPVQTNQGQPLSDIRITRGDIVPDGPLQAKATWNVTGHESYRLYVTAVDDFQKVYFDSGVVNDATNPLVIKISGLVCNKELRTVIEFFSKKNGEGERQVTYSRQLNYLPCP